MEVLWETGEPNGDGLLWNGLTGNYLRVSARSGPGLRNVITPVHLTADTPDGLLGHIVSRPQAVGQ
jgi:hypothetical protein